MSTEAEHGTGRLLTCMHVDEWLRFWPIRWDELALVESVEGDYVEAYENM